MQCWAWEVFSLDFDRRLDIGARRIRRSLRASIQRHVLRHFGAVTRCLRWVTRCKHSWAPALGRAAMKIMLLALLQRFRDNWEWTWVFMWKRASENRSGNWFFKWVGIFGKHSHPLFASVEFAAVKTEKLVFSRRQSWQLQRCVHNMEGNSLKSSFLFLLLLSESRQFINWNFRAEYSETYLDFYHLTSFRH